MTLLLPQRADRLLEQGISMGHSAPAGVGRDDRAGGVPLQQSAKLPGRPVLFVPEIIHKKANSMMLFYARTEEAAVSKSLALP